MPDFWDDLVADGDMRILLFQFSDGSRGWKTVLESELPEVRVRFDDDDLWAVVNPLSLEDYS